MLFFFRPEVYANFRWLLLLGVLVGVYFGAAAGISRNDLAPEWLPIAFVALPVGALWDGRMALVLVFVLGAITGTLQDLGDYGTVLTVLAGGGAAAMSVKAVRRRSQTWVSIALIAAAMSLALLGHGLVTGHELGDVARASAFSVGNATLSALIAMGFLWVFELFTGITTDQTLLEWADPARPLLKQYLCCGVGDVQQRYVDSFRHGRRDPMHGVGTDQEEIRATRLEAPCGVGQDLGSAVPVAEMLQFFNRRKIDAVHQDLRRMQSAEALLYTLVHQAVIKLAAFPAHARDQADGLHRRFVLRIGLRACGLFIVSQSARAVPACWPVCGPCACLPARLRRYRDAVRHARAPGEPVFRVHESPAGPLLCATRSRPGS